jgi:hypothetical protein
VARNRGEYHTVAKREPSPDEIRAYRRLAAACVELERAQKAEDERRRREAAGINLSLETSSRRRRKAGGGRDA